MKISILGSGNVATHLAVELYRKGIKIEEIFSYSIENAKKLADKINSNYTDKVEGLREADLYIISILDDKVREVSHKIPYDDKLVVHTSGTLDIEILSSKNRRGVFYPLQTFSKNRDKIDFSKIPFCIEAESKKDEFILYGMASRLSKKIYNIDSYQRKIIHLSAVFVCNFVNHFYNIGKNICDENNIPFEILNPLIKETSDKISEMSPKDAQTGPAKREDFDIINKHLEFIRNEKYKEIYSLITESIINENNNN